MRRVIRAPLDVDTQDNLNQRQTGADQKRGANNLRVNDEWKNSRQSRTLLSVLATLRGMTGARERCMYCLDSHGTDIEHFWPKTPYPERMFVWPNLLLCCTECGRLKGDRFPLADAQSLLIDPTAEDPWQHLDFDPTTGNVVARFDVQADDWSPKGLKTVEVLQLDRREALAAGYQKTFRRISALVEHGLAAEVFDTAGLMSSLHEADEHGLLGWCFFGSGRSMPSFSDLRANHPQAWAECMAALELPANQ